MILNEKLGELEWSDDEVKNYLQVHKMLLMADKLLPRLADDEVPPPAESKQTAKMAIKRKELAKKPTKGVEIRAAEIPPAKKPRVVIKRSRKTTATDTRK